MRRKRRRGNSALASGVAIGSCSWSMVNEEDVEAQLRRYLDSDRRRQWWSEAVAVLSRGGGESEVRRQNGMVEGFLYRPRVKG
jgi:hypothetical protein